MMPERESLAEVYRALLVACGRGVCRVEDTHASRYRIEQRIVKKARRLVLVPARKDGGHGLSSPAAVAALARQIVPDDGREHFFVFCLGSQNGLIAAHEVSAGTVSASLVSPAGVFGPAMRLLGVASVVLVHNHPSGDTTPSREDIRLTRQLVEGGRILDIRVHDHVIISHGTDALVFVSLAERGLL